MWRDGAFKRMQWLATRGGLRVIIEIASSMHRRLTYSQCSGIAEFTVPLIYRQRACIMIRRLVCVAREM